MKQSFKHSGFWWFPEDPDTEFFGELLFVPGETIKLEVQKIIDSPKEFSDLDMTEIPIIVGIDSTNGREITLSKCQPMGQSISMSGTSKITYVVNTLFLDIHFEDPAEAKFEKISLRFSNLEEWANKNPIIRESVDNNWKKQLIRFNTPESIKAILGDFDVELQFWGPSISSPESYKLMVGYEARIEIKPSRKMTFDEYLPIIRKLQNFFGLAMGAPTFPVALTGTSEKNKITRDNGEELYPPIEIFYPVAGWPKELSEQRSYSMLFTLDTLQDNFGPYLGKWIENYDLLEPAINLYFSVLYSPHSFVEVRFLSMAQAVETYHRRMFGGSYQDDENYLADLYPKFLEVLPEEMSKNYKSSLQGKLQYMNEYSLRTRLKELIDSIKDVLDFDFVNTGKHRKSFVSYVVNTRNYLTHYSHELFDKSAKLGSEKIMLITRLQLILEIRFMLDIGFEPDQIRELIQRSYRYRLLVQKSWN